MRLRISCLILLLFVFGCGGDYFDAYLNSGDTIEVGAVRRISYSAPFTIRQCPLGENSSDCVSPTNFIVGLTPEFSYAGDPEVVYGFQSYLFGEDNLEEPRVTDCGELGKIYSIYVPRDSLDLDEEYSSILGEIGDSVLDSASQELRINVRAERSGSGVPIFLQLNDYGYPTCEQVFESTPGRIVNVKE